MPMNVVAVVFVVVVATVVDVFSISVDSKRIAQHLTQADYYYYYFYQIFFSSFISAFLPPRRRTDRQIHILVIHC